jgi:outer membrane protein OmpA-like peptidoglycan-associated protein
VITKAPVTSVVVAVKPNNVPVLSGQKLIKPLLFAPNSTVLSATAISQLRALAAQLKDSKGTLFVTGFVFKANVSPTVMKRIATMRAKNVSLQLSRLGIKANICYLGYGPNNIVSPTAKDRKVELRWVNSR